MIENLRSNGDPVADDFIKSFAQIHFETKAKEKAWIDTLIEKGYKAAHPNDGWVNREEKSVRFAYPDFNLFPQIGDLIALGRYDDFITVKVLSIDNTCRVLGNRYYFEKV